MKIDNPDYDNCCVNIIASVCKNFGLKPMHKTLPILDRELSKDYRNVVVILLDGLGQSTLMRKLPEDSFLRSHFVQELSAVFPSSTTPSTVSYKSGLTPIEHGWWAHYLYLKEVGASINLYLNTDNYSKKQLTKKHIAQNVMPYDNILDTIWENTPEDVHCYALCNRDSRDETNVSQLVYEDLNEMCELIHSLVLNDGRKYIYAYHNFPDDLMHKEGPNSLTTERLLSDIDAQLQVLCELCPDTLFIISSDHGQTEIMEVRDIADYPDLNDCLLMPPNGLSRCFNFNIKPNRNKEFEKLAKKYFGDKFVLLSKKQVLDLGLLGRGTPHHKIDDTLGDYLLIAVDDCNLVITTQYELPIIQPIGHHGGLTREEMRVPLIVYGNKNKYW